MSAEAYKESERLLRALHELARKDLDETPEADALRDQSDAPWYAMTEAEQSKIRQLSADLWAEYDAERAKQ